MKKLCFLLAVLVLVLCGCSDSVTKDTQGASSGVGSVPSTGVSSPATGGQTTSPALSGDELTAEAARDIALAHAGVTADQVIGLRTEPDRDRGVLHYDVEFHYDGYEYDYEIDAATGAVLSSEKDRDD